MAPPSLVSTMSMSITPQASSESFVTSGKLSSRPPSGPNAPADLDGLAPPGEAEKTEPSKRILSSEEIARHRSENDAWIVVDGKVYDVSQFLETHPGGEEMILDHLKSEAAEDAGLVMKGKVGEDGHSHSKAAFRMLEQFQIGFVETAPGSLEGELGRKKYRFDVDLTKPIVPQVGYLGADYDDWVHDPIVCKESPRFFESNLAEFFTRTSWWVIPLVWCPVSFTMLYLAVVNEGVPISRLPFLITGGVIIWTFLEYQIHRFLFHMKTSGFWTNTLHYILHGFHHKHPMDGARLVFPPAFTGVICTIGFHHKHPMDGSRLVFPPAFASVICYGIWFLVGTWVASYPDKLVLYASALMTYVCYDLTHYFLHFGTAFNENSRKMKRYHLNHHFKDQTIGYGITTTFWDLVFRTLPSEAFATE